MTSEDLKLLQGLPTVTKIRYAKEKIQEWYEHWEGQVYVAFSGGKDSTVLLHLVRQLYPEVPAVFVDTGLEFPEIKEFVKTIDNVVWLKPKMSFPKVLEKYGYPVVSKSQACAISRYRNTKSELQKHRRLNGWPAGKKGMISKKYQYLVHAPFKISDECCMVMKIRPIDEYAKSTSRYGMNGAMAADSKKRHGQVLKYGCNSFNTGQPLSRPLSIWLEKDVWACLNAGIPYSSIYTKGYDRTGCIFCMFGCHMEEHSRFERLAKTHPKIHRYCMDQLGLKEVLEFMNLPTGEETKTNG